MRPLKVLHCIAGLNYSDGGPARSVPALAEAMAEHGAEVTVFCHRPPTIDLTPFPNTRFISGDISAASAGGKPDIIHDHGLWLPSNHKVAGFSRRHRIPRIVSPRGMLEPWCLKHKRLRKQLAWRLYQHHDLLSADCLHATSAAESAQFRSLGFRQPIISIPNGVTLPDEDASDDLTEHADSKEILFLSRIHPVKGLMNLLDAWKLSAAPGWKLRIVGSDEDGHRRELDERIRALQAENEIRTDDAVHSDQKWTLLKNAAVVVLPSFSENFGIIVAEALGVGTPVITTTGTPWSEIESRQCGWYTKPTVPDLADALKSAMAVTPAERNLMGRRGRQWIRESFTRQKTGRQMLDCCEWLLGRTAGGNTEIPVRPAEAA